MNVVKVNLPTPLIEYSAGKRNVEAVGANLDELLQDLDQRHPGIRFRMIDEQGHVRPHIKLFVNAQMRRSLTEPLQNGDEVMIVAALSGG